MAEQAERWLTVADGQYTAEQYREAARLAQQAGDIASAKKLIQRGMAAEAAPAAPVVTPVPQTLPPGATPIEVPPVEPVTSVTEPQESLVKRSTRRAGQEILATPGAPGAMYGLAGAAWDRYVNGVPWDEAMLSEEGRDLIDRVKAGQATPEEIAALEANPAAILRTGLQAASEWYTWGGETTGVTDNPDGSVPLDEEVGGIVGSTLLTLPAALVSKPLAVINKISNTAVRTGLKTALRGAEMVTPVTVGAGKYGSNIAANAAVQVAINDVTRELMDDETLASNALSVITDEEQADAMTGFPEDEGDGIDSGDVAAVGTVGALAAIVGGGRAINRSLRDTTARITSQGSSKLGVMPVRDSAMNAVGDVVQNMNTTVLDESNILIEGMRRTGVRRDRIEAFDDFMRSEAGTAANTARDRFIETGVLDADGSIRTQVPFLELDKAYNKLDAVKRKRIDNYIIARDEQSRRARGVYNMTHLSDNDLVNIVRANGTPEVRKFASLYFDQGARMSDYRHKHGIIDAAQHAREQNAYMPNIEAEPKRTGIAGLWDQYSSKGRDSVASDVSAFEKQAKGGIAEKVPPMEAMRRYINAQMQEVGATRVRRTWLKQMAGRHVTDYSQGRRIVAKKLTGDERGIPVTVREDGKSVTYFVGDPRIAKALQFNPQVVAGFGFNTMRKWFQQGTTGYLNPAFAPVSLAYDAFAGMLGGRTDRVVTGMIDDRLARLGMSPEMRNYMAILRPLDTLTVLGEGLYQGATGRIKEEYAVHMARRAAASGMPIDKVAADAAMNRFIDSKYGAMQMQGYSGNMMTEGLTELNSGFLERMTNAITNPVKRNMLSRAYVSALDGIRDAYRLGMFTRNVAHQQWLNKQSGAPAKLSQAQYRKIVNHVREVSVDPSKRGASDNLNRITSAVPYGNIALHSAAHMMRNILTNQGALVSMGSLIMTTWALHEAMSPEAKDHLKNRVPDYRRGTSITFEIPHDGEPFDAQKHLFHLPLGPEPGLIVHGVLDGLSAWLNEGETGDRSMPQKLRAALFDMVIPAMPPILNVGAAAAGYGPLDTESAMRGDSLFRQPQIEGGVPEMRGVGQNDGFVTDRLFYMVSSVLGSFGRTLMDSAEVLDSELQQPDASMREGIEKVFDVVKFNMVDRQRFGALFGNAVTQSARGTPLSEKAYAIRNFAESAQEFARDLVPSFTEGPLDADMPYDTVMTVIAEGLRDPALQQQAMLIHEGFMKTPAVSEGFRDLSQLRSSYFRTQSNVEQDISERNTVLNKINDDMHAKYQQILQSYGMFEDRMRQITGDPEWTIDTFLTAARADVYAD